MRPQMAFNVKRQRMLERLACCGVVGAACPPMTWTISNRLAEFAPSVLRWYFRRARPDASFFEKLFSPHAWCRMSAAGPLCRTGLPS